MEKIFEWIHRPAAVLVVLALLLLFKSWLFRRLRPVSSDGGMFRRSVGFLLVLAGTVAFVLSLPVEGGLKGQILSFLGILLSAGIALSSTTVLGNLIAGIMNNSMNRFRHGDLIKIEELQGRVTKISIFHTEIQLEDSNFMTIPNLYIASHPVKLTRETNTVISCSVSLGYDTGRLRIEEALKEAAEATGLSDPYVYITSLGDFSVQYRIHGFLEDSSKFFSTASQLKGNVMDTLHRRGIEIVSPAFMNQRRVDAQRFIPSKRPKDFSEGDESIPEELIFDKAIESEEIEKQKDYLKEIDEKQAALKEKRKEAETVEEKERLRSHMERLENFRTRIRDQIRNQNTKEKK